MAAPFAALLPHGTGGWLPLHLFLVGGLLNAISGVTQMLAVTWSASPAPPRWATALQRETLSIGTVAVVLGRELDNRGLAAAGGTAVVFALVVLGANLVRIRGTAVTNRFVPAIDGYLLAIATGVVGTLLAVALVSGRTGARAADIRAAHLTSNLYGLVGIVIIATLPYFVATQLRTKMSSRATPWRLRGLNTAVAAATGVAVVGRLINRPMIAAAGLGAYAVGIIAVTIVLPTPRLHQLKWAGPRLIQLGSGIAWWVVTTVILSVSVLADHTDQDRILWAMVVGGFAQILMASLAYLAPVLRGGGHQQLSAGFRITRSWVAVVAANIAAVAALSGRSTLLAIGLAAWVADTFFRVARLMGARQPRGTCR